MRAFNVNVAVALPTTVPFVPNNTVVCLNLGAATDRLQTSATLTGVYATLAEIPSNEAVEVTLDNPFIRSEDLINGKLVLLAN
jgi:hypothetical protein